MKALEGKESGGKGMSYPVPTKSSGEKDTGLNRDEGGAGRRKLKSLVTPRFPIWMQGRICCGRGFKMTNSSEATAEEFNLGNI